MKIAVLILCFSLLGLNVFATTGEYEITAKSVLSNLDCAGSVGSESAGYFYARLKSSQDSNVISVETRAPNFAKSLLVSDLITRSNSVVFLGENPEFILSIEKFGVHGAHNAKLILPEDSSAKQFSLECYF